MDARKELGRRSRGSEIKGREGCQVSGYSREKWPQRTGTLVKDVQRNKHHKRAGNRNDSVKECQNVLFFKAEKYSIVCRYQFCLCGWTRIASTSWLLWIVLVWTWVNNCIFLSMKFLPGRKSLKIKHLKFSGTYTEHLKQSQKVQGFLFISTILRESSSTRLGYRSRSERFL